MNLKKSKSLNSLNLLTKSTKNPSFPSNKEPPLCYFIWYPV